MRRHAFAKGFGLHHPVQVVKDRMGPQGLDCRCRRQDSDPGAADRRHTQMAVLKGKYSIASCGTAFAGSPDDVGRRFTFGRRVMADASTAVRTSFAGERPWLSIVKRKRPSSRK